MASTTSFASFSKTVKSLLIDASVNNKIQINGSFNSSYWASDVDLYVDCSDTDIQKVYKQIRKYCLKYKPIEIKIVRSDGNSKKYKRLPALSKLKNTATVKIDTIFRGLAFPIDCSVIYDWQPERTYDGDKLIQTFIQEIAEKKYGAYKAIKRFETIGRMLGFKTRLFPKVSNNTTIGVMYLSANRLIMLNDNHSQFSSEEREQLKDTIREDLRRVGEEGQPISLQPAEILKKLDELLLALL